MTTSHAWPRRIAIAGALAAISGCGLFGGGSSAQPMHSARSVPAGQGTVRVSAEDNGNTAIAVRVKHLAPASKLAADATVYVVWIRPRNGPIQSVGALMLDSNLEGKLDTITPHQRFTVMVTPEPSARVERPTHEAVFTSEVDQVD